jgi:choline dehydrogenase-like flavoprotein
MLGGMAAQVKPDADVLVVGSGPVGSAFARSVHERAPGTQIVMLEAGPRLTDRPGVHVRNIADADGRRRAQLLAEGPGAVDDGRSASAAPEPGKPRPGTALVDRDNAAFPEAAISTNVGGMGAHWTCASPRPGAGERIPFIADRELDDLLETGERYLGVRQDVFSDSAEGRAILDTLRATYDSALPPERRVDPMPLACAATDDGRPWWSGSDVVLGPLAEPGVDSFELRSDTICRRLVVDGTRVVEAEVEHRPTGRGERLTARAFFVACDALRTPQLLWASGVRPRALGRFLNDHIQVVCGVTLASGSIRREAGLASARRDGDDPVVGVFWVPYSAPHHPFHGQVMHLDMSPIAIVDGAPAEHVVGLGWFVPKEIRAEDRVTVSDDRLDAYGMPAIRIEYGLTARDRESVEAAIADLERGATALGEPVPGRGPTLVPAGSSLHYQGTTRMGEADDGESVCDPFSRLWGLDNLFVGGNGVIPTATASNPTLTSVALAIRAAGAVA